LLLSPFPFLAKLLSLYHDFSFLNSCLIISLNLRTPFRSNFLAIFSCTFFLLFLFYFSFIIDLMDFSDLSLPKEPGLLSSSLLTDRRVIHKCPPCLCSASPAPKDPGSIPGRGSLDKRTKASHQRKV
jgi:hypothetical protein